MVCILHFINMAYHVDWFANVEPPLHTWNKSRLIIGWDLFKVLLCLVY